MNVAIVLYKIFPHMNLMNKKRNPKAIYQPTLSIVPKKSWKQNFIFSPCCKQLAKAQKNIPSADQTFGYA
uniref:Uncharacterized protein n=1 Tax=Arundo donax TaxID=35708 RepID=A0A0A9BH75_ARUDO